MTRGPADSVGRAAEAVLVLSCRRSFPCLLCSTPCFRGEWRHYVVGTSVSNPGGGTRRDNRLTQRRDPEATLLPAQYGTRPWSCQHDHEMVV